MRILMINPPDAHTIPEWSLERSDTFVEVSDYGRYPPLGLLYVLSYLEAHTRGHELRLIDCVGEGLSHADAEREIRAFCPDVVGITSFTLSLIDVRLIARAIRRHFPHAHICLGGHHPIGFPFEAARLPEIDSIVVGEGEAAFTALVDALEAGRDFTDIRGVYTAQSIERFRGPPVRDTRFLGSLAVPAAYIEDLGALPMPNRRYIEHVDYENPLGRGGRMTTLISSRGCPYRCTYCDVPYKRHRRIPIARMLDEVEDCLARGYRELHYYDDLFNVTAERLVEYCDEVERRGLRFRWDFRGRVNSVTRESLARAKAAGCWMISFGVETGTDEGLAAIKKGTDTAAVRRAFEWCRELGIVTVADYMIGFPFEREREDVRRSIDYLLSLRADYALISILMLLPNTEIYGEAVAKGLADPSKWARFAADPGPHTRLTVDYWTEHLSAEELIHLRRESYRRFYLRPGFVLRTLGSIRRPAELRKKLGGLGTLLRKGILRGRALSELRLERR